ncbi:protein ACCELERATED CELL DEATH 6 isoform X1 [Elaeis guineensis]|uniref:protein ACCELERATED CELL DEATH 6 isoform X1 n=1 Tax=Elaeis guineensis var. tenera TaxID=51953 RepID=UPI003C6D7EDA
MAEAAEATAFIGPADTELEVPLSEVQPQRIAINPKLLEAARLGDKSILDKLLRPKDGSSKASERKFTITISEDAATQRDTNCLLGVTLEGNTALHIVATRGHLELAKEICHIERSLLLAQNVRLDTPLHCAARVGDDKMVSLIIQFAREDENEARRVLTAKNRDDANALHEAAKYDHVCVAKVLIEEHAELISMWNNAGMSPLYLAIRTGSLNVAKTLLQSFSWEKTSLASYAGFNKHTALHAATKINREITEAILQWKPTLNKCADCFGRIPLHYVASNGHRDMAKLLLEYDRSIAYLSDADGFFPIHIAAIKGNIDVVDQILEYCPDTDELLDYEGKNFLHVAFACRRLDLVKKIISKRPDLRKLLNDQDNMGNTPLHTAVKNSDQGSVYFLLRDKSVSPNIINHDGFTPLDLAYVKLDRGLFDPSDATSSIAGCLAFSKALFGPPQKAESSSDGDKKKPSGNDSSREKSSSIEDKDLKKQLNISQNFGIASALIATVTFAAAFTVPGGFIADDHPDHGTAVLAKEYAFKVFLVSDAFAFICSILATLWFVIGGKLTSDRSTRVRAIISAERCVYLAFSGMSAAFAMGMYAMLPPSCKSISIVLCIAALGTPLLADVVPSVNLYSLLKTIGIRQGYRHWIWPTTIYPHVGKTLSDRSRLNRGAVIVSLRRALVTYAILFLLPMLLDLVSKN